MMVATQSRAELHVHLEGAVSHAALKALDPALTDDEISRELSYADFDGFIRAFVWVNRKLRTPADYEARRCWSKNLRQAR